MEENVIFWKYNLILFDNRFIIIFAEDTDRVFQEIAKRRSQLALQKKIEAVQSSRKFAPNSTQYLTVPGLPVTN